MATLHPEPLRAKALEATGCDFDIAINERKYTVTFALDGVVVARVNYEHVDSIDDILSLLPTTLTAEDLALEKRLTLLRHIDSRKFCKNLWSAVRNDTACVMEWAEIEQESASLLSKEAHLIVSMSELSVTRLHRMLTRA